MGVPELLFLFLFAVGGYFLVSQLWPVFSKKPTRPEPEEDAESYCRRVLGVGADADRGAIEQAYLERLLKYDPSKFTEYGPEFCELAEQRTKAIVSAYRFLAGKSDRIRQ
jgi:hypothetical protein